MESTVRFINPSTMSTPPGYTHVVEVTGGRTIYIAGQVALDKSGTLVGPGDMHVQTRQVFENLKVALAAVNASFDNVVKLNIYTTDIKQLAALREVRDNYVNTKNPPASTAVEVKALARDGFMIEIEAIAAIPE
ncbi:MAG TPA: RidA family protein [Blastocatellia bacterium]|nr:RidA family protein [Blastocatellia bacterium]